MSLRFAASGRERHTSNSRAVGPWSNPSFVTIIGASGGFRLAHLATGGGPNSTYGSKCWWSGRTPPPVFFNNGSYANVFKLFEDSSGTVKNRYWAWKNTLGNLYLALCSNSTGTELRATQYYSGTGDALYKLEYDAPTWTCWAKMGSGRSWQQEFTYTETSPTSPYTFSYELAGATDETFPQFMAVDFYDLCMWDSEGDNWNSRIATLADIPKVSVAHVLTTPEKDTQGQAVKLDEIPTPSATPDFATVTDANWWATPPALDASVTDTIQAVMVTNVGKTNIDSEVGTFNLREGGVIDQKTFSGWPAIGLIQNGSDGSLTSIKRRTFAAYWPWTPAGKLWTPNRFAGTGGEASMEYGIGLVGAADFSPAVTLAEDLDTTETGVDVNDASGITTPVMIVVDSERMYASSKTGNTLTVTRGADGTTAATHTTGAAVKRAAVTDQVTVQVISFGSAAEWQPAAAFVPKVMMF